jgi:hypothetical protein
VKVLLFVSEALIISYQALEIFLSLISVPFEVSQIDPRVDLELGIARKEEGIQSYVQSLGLSKKRLVSLRDY